MAFECRAFAGQSFFDVGLAETGAQISPPHGVVHPHPPGLSLEMVIGEKGRAQGPAGVAGGGLNPDVGENIFPRNPAVGDAVKGHAACQTKIAGAAVLGQASGEAEHDLFRHRLDRRRQVHVALGQACLPGCGAGRRKARQTWRWSWSARCSNRNMTDRA